MRASFLLLTYYLLFHLIIQSHGQTNPAEKFELVKKEGVISIFEHWVIFPNSDPPIEAREVKGEFLINSSMYEILHLIKDESKIKIWQSHVSKFKVYPQSDTSVWQEYSYHDIPWPVSDQDHFLEYRLSELTPSQELFITFQSVVNQGIAPKQKGVTRMILSGSWRLEQLSELQVKVTYRIFSMPIGIPRIFTDPIIRSNLMSTIKALTRLAEK
jgi:hypothetical protein